MDFLLRLLGIMGIAMFAITWFCVKVIAFVLWTLFEISIILAWAVVIGTIEAILILFAVIFLKRM
jgi:hypothetical protein